MELLFVALETVSSTTEPSGVDWRIIATLLVTGSAVVGAGIKLYKDVHVAKTQIHNLQTELSGLRNGLNSLKDELQQGLKDLKDELQQGLKDLKDEFQPSLKGLKDEWKDESKSLKGELKDEIKGVRQNVYSYQKLLNTLLFNLFDGTFKQHSPIGLTSQALKMAQESGIDDLINNNLARYKEQLDHLQSEVEIFDQCEQIVHELSQDNNLLNIREYFYNRAFDWVIVQRIISIRLRDIYLNAKQTSKSPQTK